MLGRKPVQAIPDPLATRQSMHRLGPIGVLIVSTIAR
jgi:hypothetical protein